MEALLLASGAYLAYRNQDKLPHLQLQFPPFLVQGESADTDTTNDAGAGPTPSTPNPNNPRAVTTLSEEEMYAENAEARFRAQREQELSGGKRYAPPPPTTRRTCTTTASPAKNHCRPILPHASGACLQGASTTPWKWK